MRFDYCVIGGGIVGLATAMAVLKRQPGASLVLLEKENGLARHQTGHNSGVVHSGIYYAPGSLKAQLCRRGASATKEFCRDQDIPIETCGKILVATNDLELKRMEELLGRARINEIDVERLDAAALKQFEPRIAGLAGLFVRSTAIVDYGVVSQRMGELIAAVGANIELGVNVTSIRENSDDVTILAGERCWTARRLIACAGLQSDRIARAAGLEIKHRIIPFRGEYYRLPESKEKLVQRLIYPIPDPALPFLGVHLTRMIDGRITVGPNAVLGFAREGYHKLSFHGQDVSDYLRFPGFWKTMGHHLRFGVIEMRNSLWKTGYLKECRRYYPELTLSDLLPEKAGIRAQAVLRDGTLVHDFLFLETARMLHVCNAPSPAATSAIPIGEMIADKCTEARP